MIALQNTTHSQHNVETPAPANHLSAGRGVILSPSALPPASCLLPPANCQRLPPPPDPESPYLFATGLRNALAIEAVAAIIIYAIWRVLI